MTVGFALLLLTSPATGGTFNILYAGSPAGTVIYSRSASGSFVSKMNLKVGGVTISSVLRANFVGGKLIRSNAVSTSPMGNTTVSCLNGKVSVTTPTKTVSAVFNFSNGPWAANNHPELWSDVIKSFEKDKSKPLLPLLLDAGRVIPVTLTSEGERTVQIGGKPGKVRRFDLKLAAIHVALITDMQFDLVGFDDPMQNVRFVLAGWEGVFENPLAKYPELSQPTFEAAPVHHVMIAMRDGVKLAADVFLPKAAGPFPCILERTPYGKALEEASADFYVRRGYAYVVEDCRGRSGSEGKWQPFVNEGKDGCDTIEWVTRQAWCTGKVGMIGGSYLGYVQWAAAVLKPKGLVCIVPQVSPPGAMENIPFDQGVFALFPDLWWARIVEDKKTDLSGLSPVLPHMKELAQLPISKLDKAVLGHTISFYQDWLKRETLGHWKGFDFTSHLQSVRIPALMISGWWDGDEPGTMIAYSTLRALGRDNLWLIYGPWVHAFDTSTSLGDVDYGKAAYIPLLPVYLRWFDTWLKGKDVGLAKMPRVQAFFTGDNRWVDLASWPDTAAEKQQSLFLSAGSSAVIGSGVGSLSPSHFPHEMKSSYEYDPSVDSKIPGAKEMAASTLKIDLKDLAPGLSFETPPMKTPLSLAGPLYLDLFYSSSAQDTDFFATLIDVSPDGLMHIVGQPGKLRCSYRDGLAGRSALKPGTIYESKIRLWDTAHTFVSGHRMMLVVTSGMFPDFARDLGTMDPIATATVAVKQHDTVYHDAAHPSRLIFWQLKQAASK